MAKLKDKVAIITGAASGMGEAHARKFVEEGATVVIADVSDARENLATELGDNAVAMKLDVTDENNWKEVVETVDYCGPIAPSVRILAPPNADRNSMRAEGAPLWF